MKSKSLVSNYYDQKSVSYGVNRTRLKHTLDLIGNIHNKRVLDVGCARGYIGAYLKKNNNYVVGVDTSAQSIVESKKILDKAFVLDIEQDRLSKLGSKKFDLIILAEVVEHLFQPDQAIQKLSQVLKNKGLLFLSTPNLLYWGNRIRFLKGDFEYSKQGIFDESHVHFFTYATTISLLQRLRFSVIKEHHLFGGKIGRYMGLLFPNVFIYHTIILAQKN